MMKSALSDLPPSDHRKLASGVRLNLARVVKSLETFSQSVRQDSLPIWPGQEILTLFTAQVCAYRAISLRRKDATVIQIIREMDKRWPGLDLSQAIKRLVDAVDFYCGSWPFSKLIVERKSAILFDAQLKRIMTFLNKEIELTPGDLALVLPVLSSSFEKMNRLISVTKLRPLQGGQPNAVPLLRRLFARTAQELLIARYAEFLARKRAAHQLRIFIFNLEEWEYRRRLFGLSDKQVKRWKKEQRSLHKRALTKVRVARYRASKRKSSVTAVPRPDPL